MPHHVEVLLPVYNEVASLAPLMRELDRVVEPLLARVKVSFLFINDGSRDGSTQLLERLAKQRSDVRVIHLLHNFGHGAALACGIDYARGDALLIMDADLQDSPDAIPALIEAWEKGAHTVVVERGERKENHRWAFSVFYWLLRQVAQGLPGLNFGTHCLLDRSVIERLRKLPERNRYLPGLVAYASGPIHSIRMDRAKRLEGGSRVGAWGLIQLATTALVSFSALPIRLVSLFGLVAAGTAMAAGLGFVAIKVFTPYAIPGWASTMTAIALASGVQLLCLGLMGEYVARIYDEVKQRPLYLVDKVHEPAQAKVASGAQ